MPDTKLEISGEAAWVITSVILIIGGYLGKLSIAWILGIILLILFLAYYFIFKR